MSRQLRSKAKPTPEPTAENNKPPNKDIIPPLHFIPSTTPSDIIFDKSLPGLNRTELQTLRKKQQRLKNSITATLATAREEGPQATHALAATLIFAQEEAGTGVCIDARGWILTCAHCFGETPEEWQSERRKWLLYYTGLAVQVECRVWDARRDLALAKIIRVEMEISQHGDSTASARTPLFSNVVPAKTQTPTAPIFCIGQPGADDLESASPRKTAYDLIEVSTGRLRGLIPNADPQDNAEIGCLKHDAWTYWGHSGAPLLRQSDGAVLGLHSSWDDSTAMRHGVPLVAIRAFLDENLDLDLTGSNGDRLVDSRSRSRPGHSEAEAIVIDD